MIAVSEQPGLSDLEQIVQNYGKKVFRLGMNITGNWEDSEDIAQDTFLKCFKHLDSFRGDSQFATWLTRIALNEGLMKLRKRRTCKEVSVEGHEGDEDEVLPWEFVDARPTPEKAYEWTELNNILWKGIRCLPLIFQPVFLLRAIEEFSTKETAALLGLTISTVKSRLSRARERLRRDLGRVFRQV